MRAGLLFLNQAADPRPFILRGRRIAKSVRRYLALVPLIVAVLLGATLSLKLAMVRAQSNQVASATPVRPNEGAIIGGPNAAASPIPSPSLQCQGCHGPDKQLPYLAGSLFHSAPHAAYDHSFHAQAIRNGTK